MINMKDKSLIIFDWDGTLMDSVGLIVAAMRYAAEKHGLTVTDDATKSIIGIALVDAFPMLFPNDSDKYDELLATYSEYYVKHCDNDKLFDGIKELIQDLHAQGKTLARLPQARNVKVWSEYCPILELKPFSQLPKPLMKPQVSQIP